MATKILLVEDNPDDEALTLRIMKKNGILNEIVVVRDGLEAIEYLFGKGKFANAPPLTVPHVILLDLQLPKRDGMSVLKEIKAHESTHELPVIILTSSDDDQDIINSYFFGANIFLRKPVRFKQFADAFEKLGVALRLRPE
jgi:two-component system response regulator